MSNNFTTSVNIIRDTERDFNYIPTPNAKQVVSQIVNDFKRGIRSFNIIGNYGTGKSSFLLALEQSIRGKKRYFDPNFIGDKPKFDFVKIIGSYESLEGKFADEFEVETKKNVPENILSEIFNRYSDLGKSNSILFLLLDEFGKFLEYASTHNPEKELYFIQQLAEFCNNPKYNIVLITTVHQSFDSYAYSLTSTQKQEWTKVKGRFREIVFNEPVEQLLYLASEYVAANFNISLPKKTVDECFTRCSKTKAFSYNQDFAREIAHNIYPLDILAANVLTLALQRYGQNERSLFSFLESTDHTSVIKFSKLESPFYSIANVYDYLHYNFYSFLTSKFNRDFSAWSSINSAIEKVEREIINVPINDSIKAVKTIGLLNIFSAQGAKLDSEFLAHYLQTTCGIPKAMDVISSLEKKSIIRYRAHSNRFILFEGTDLDIQSALIEAANKVSEVDDIEGLLSQHFELGPVFAKSYSFEIGTPRYFKFKISKYPVEEKPTDDLDGVINLIFNQNLTIDKIATTSKKQEEAIIYCYFKNSREIRTLLFEIEKIKKVIEENQDDNVAKRELEHISDAQKRLLNHYINESIYKGSNDVCWYFGGKEVKINNKRDFNKLISQVCKKVYPATPVFRNELVNKHRISPSIHSAKRNYFKALCNHWDKENLGFEDGKSPPEKTIYLSLLKENGISPIRDNSFDVPSIKQDSTFNSLWKTSEIFLLSAKTELKTISEFFEIISDRPFKLKKGLVEFWVPTFLFLRRDDFALFNENGYIPNLTDEILELIAKYPEDFSIKAFDIEGVKLDIFNSYRTFLNQSTNTNINNQSFIETIKPFIIFYKQLPDYTKHTQRLSPVALKIRKAIANSTNPEETFFDDFPSALGTTLSNLQKDNGALQKYSTDLQAAVRELRTAYDNLVTRFEEFIATEILGTKVDFITLKETLQDRFRKLKKHLLLPGQKTFVQRIDSALEDKKAWFNSIAQAVIGKTLESITDEDEIKLYEGFKSMILELDSLTNISKADIDESREEVIGVKIDSFFSRIDPKIVRVPKTKGAEIESITKALKEKLGQDKTSNIAAVLNLLKELMR